MRLDFLPNSDSFQKFQYPNMDGETFILTIKRVDTLRGMLHFKKISNRGETSHAFNNNTQIIFEFTIPKAFDHLRPISALHNQMLCAGIANSQLAILGHRLVLGNERLPGKLVKPEIYSQHSSLLQQ